MSSFENSGGNADTSSKELGLPRNNQADDVGAPAAMSGASTGAGLGDSTAAASSGAGSPLTEEEAQAVRSEQPTGAGPSPDEMEDRNDVGSSAENLLPRDKLENGLKHARMLLATGWAGFTAGVRDLEQTETVGKLKEGTVTMIDRSMDGLSKVGSRVAEATDRGIVAVGSKIEEAAPAVGRWRDEVVIASERSFAAAKEMTDKAMAEIRKPGGNNAGAAEGGSSGEGSGASGAAAAEAETRGEDGPHTV